MKGNLFKKKKKKLKKGEPILLCSWMRTNVLILLPAPSTETPYSLQKKWLNVTPFLLPHGHVHTDQMRVTPDVLDNVSCYKLDD